MIVSDMSWQPSMIALTPALSPAGERESVGVAGNGRHPFREVTGG